MNVWLMKKNKKEQSYNSIVEGFTKFFSLNYFFFTFYFKKYDIA